MAGPASCGASWPALLKPCLPLQYRLPHIDSRKGEHRGFHRFLKQAEPSVPEKHHIRRKYGVICINHGTACPVHLIIRFVGRKCLIEAAAGSQAFLLGHGSVYKSAAWILGAGKIKDSASALILSCQLKNGIHGGTIPCTALIFCCLFRNRLILLQQPLPCSGVKSTLFFTDSCWRALISTTVPSVSYQPFSIMSNVCLAIAFLSMY